MFYFITLLYCSLVCGENSLASPLPFKNATSVTVPSQTPSNKESLMVTHNPVVGRFIWCINESRQRWTKVGNLTTGQSELLLKQSAKFQCPLVNQTVDMKYCCGKAGEQHCCTLKDTHSLRWGVAVGAVVVIAIFFIISYAVQIFRACDRCYHEFPIASWSSNATEFQWDTRWYTVSHEGNRYGVTFHSRSFANEFMDCLEAAYGRWNTANILKIQRDGQDFVVLSIFFHHLFTPWFYTQGPIKNDEEWIRSDFKQICLAVQERLRASSCLQLRKYFHCHVPENVDRGPQQSRCSQQQQQPSSEESASLIKFLSTVPDPHEMKETDPRVYKKWVPWTKSTYPLSTSASAQTICKTLHGASTRNRQPKRTDRQDINSTVTIIIFEDIIECNGLEKGIQTAQKYILGQPLIHETLI